ncbi:NgoMIV family type II restriction endonuclease [Mycobacterium sp. NPDC050441]|uniref:NgoMIV family type II restriction endonuclease n=1 Tax=Mycobacterium sp. NPDC050441 TaxID=3155403 RepID=UPI0033E3C5A1
MPAPFALDLCGFRDGRANTSDASEAFSIELGQALFDAMGVQPGTVPPTSLDKQMSQKLAVDLEKQLSGRDLVVESEKKLNSFDQFRHVAVIRDLKPENSPAVTRSVKRLKQFVERRTQSPPKDAKRRAELFESLENALASEVENRRRIIEEIGEEALLGLDVTASRARIGALPHLEMGLSLKWSLRTDRAQDCRSQGAKMAALRRGPMPHFAAVTMEPRPYMLRILGGGSGEVDCVYHLDLPALTAAIETTTRGNPRRRETAEIFRKLVDQRRVRDYDELIAYAQTL